MAPKLSDVSCKYGAPMGRRDTWPDDKEAPIKLHLVRLKWVDGDYDEGGAYWGRTYGTSIYWATDGDLVNVFVRSKDRDWAKLQILDDLPNAKFFR